MPVKTKVMRFQCDTGAKKKKNGRLRTKKKPCWSQMEVWEKWPQDRTR